MFGICSCKIKHFWQGQHGWFFSFIKEFLIRLKFIFHCAGHSFQLQSSFFKICLAASVISAKNTSNIKNDLLLKPYVSCRVQQKFSFYTEIKPLPSNMLGFGLWGMPSLGLNIAVLIKTRVTSLEVKECWIFWWFSTTWRCWIGERCLAGRCKGTRGFSSTSPGKESSVTGKTFLFPHQQAATRN